jgi:hypothetical protein
MWNASMNMSCEHCMAPMMGRCTECQASFCNRCTRPTSTPPVLTTLGECIFKGNAKQGGSVKVKGWWKRGDLELESFY